MRSYVLKRLLLMVPTLFGISLVLWLIMVASPGRPGAKAQAFGEVNVAADPTKEKAKGESQRIFRRHFALDRPVFWNGWASLDDEAVLGAVNAARAPVEEEGATEAGDERLQVVTVAAKRTAKERLEDWGYYSIPNLVRLLERTRGAEQDAVLYWLRMNSVRYVGASYGRAIDAETLARYRAWSEENVRLAKLGWRAGAPPEARTEVVRAWRSWFDQNRERWDRSTLQRVRIGLTDTQFATYWGRLLRFDLGVSHVHKRPVLDLILERLPVSAALAAIALLLIYVLAIPLGIWSAVRPYTVSDRTVTVGLFLLYSLPSFFVGTVLLRTFTVADPFQWFPNSGFSHPDARSWNTWARLGDTLWHITLPLVVMTYGGLAGLSRYARTGMLDVIRSDFVRTARAKGMPETVVVLRHAARNGMMPVITLLAGILPALIGGSIIVEYIFNIRGMGLLTIEAINQKDYNVVVGESLFVAILTLVGILVSDILYAVIDPRISYR